MPKTKLSTIQLIIYHFEKVQLLEKLERSIMRQIDAD